MTKHTFTYDDESDTFEGGDALVKVLDMFVKRAKGAAQIKSEHRARWEATRNAVLGGLMARPDDPDVYDSPQDPSLLETANMWANRAHGPLPDAADLNLKPDGKP